MTIDDEEREATRQLINGLRSGVNVAAAEIKSQREQLDAMRQQLTAAVSALRLVTDSTPGKTATVWMSLDAWTEPLADVARYGADQWRRGNAGQEPQEFEEWRMEQ